MSVTRVFVGEDERYYPDLSLNATPGLTHDFDDADSVPDDGRWETEAAAKKSGVKPIKPEPSDESAPAAEAEES